MSTYLPIAVSNSNSKYITIPEYSDYLATSKDALKVRLCSHIRIKGRKVNDIIYEVTNTIDEWINKYQIMFNGINTHQYNINNIISEYINNGNILIDLWDGINLTTKYTTECNKRKKTPFQIFYAQCLNSFDLKTPKKIFLPFTNAYIDNGISFFVRYVECNVNDNYQIKQALINCGTMFYLKKLKEATVHLDPIAKDKHFKLIKDKTYKIGVRDKFKTICASFPSKLSDDTNYINGLCQITINKLKQTISNALSNNNNNNNQSNRIVMQRAQSSTQNNISSNCRRNFRAMGGFTKNAILNKTKEKQQQQRAQKRYIEMEKIINTAINKHQSMQKTPNKIIVETDNNNNIAFELQQNDKENITNIMASNQSVNNDNYNNNNQNMFVINDLSSITGSYTPLQKMYQNYYI